MRLLNRLLGLLLVSTVLVSCAANIRQAPLHVGDDTLDRVSHLGILAVHVTTERTDLKLRGLNIHDAADQLIVMPFFDNVLLKSKALPVKIEKGFVQQIALLDLEPGTYTVTELDFASTNDRNADQRVFSHTPTMPIVVRVSDDKVTYLGRVTVTRSFEEREVDDKGTGVIRQAFMKANLSSEYDIDTSHARDLYTALDGISIADTSDDGD